MALRIRFEGGPNAGKVLSFGDEVEIVAIGRDPDRCQVLFPADETQVGREHCALKRILGRYRLTLNAENPVFIDGKPARPDQEIGAGEADLQLGRSGPKLVLEVLGNETLPGTIDQGARMPGHGTLLERLARSTKTTRVMLGVVVLVTLAASVFGYMAFRKSETRLAEMIVQRTTQQEVKVKAAEPKIRDALVSADRSVYLVILRNDRGEDSPLGTAWVARPGLLATNAHVAEVFEKLAAGHSLSARSPANPPRDYPIKNVTLHPGYRQFQHIWKDRAPVRIFGPSIDVLSNIPACDVATMEVGSGDALAAPLALASAEELAALEAGDVVGYVGYPMEGMVMGGTNPKRPSPQTQIAHLTNVTDFFMVRDMERGGQLIQHALPATGGASGSPIINASGKVVALLNAGNVVLTLTGRAPHGVNVNFAQRADLLEELLSGRAAEAQRLRSEKWRSDIQQFASLKDAWQDVVKRRVELWQRAIGTASSDRVAEYSGRLKVIRGAPVFGEERSLLAEPGSYLVVAISTDAHSLGMVLFDEQGQPIVEQKISGPVSMINIDLAGRGKLGVAVLGPSETTNYVLHIYRAQGRAKRTVRPYDK